MVLCTPLLLWNTPCKVAIGKTSLKFAMSSEPFLLGFIWPALGIVRVPTRVYLNNICSDLYSGQWRCYMPALSESLKLKYDWDAQIPPRVVKWTKRFARSHQTLFPSSSVRSGYTPGYGHSFAKKGTWAVHNTLDLVWGPGIGRQ
jgi:hypothetical protein